MIWRERVDVRIKGQSKMNPEHLIAQIRRKLLKKRKIAKFGTT